MATGDQGSREEASEVRRAALLMLSRRDYARTEMQRKLQEKFNNKTIIDTVLDELVASGYQSDERYIEMYVRSRRERGYGPVYIQQALRALHLSPDMIQSSIDAGDPVWMDYARKAKEKKFGAAIPGDSAGKARIIRFLQYRGFGMKEINAVTRQQDDHAG